MPPRRAVKEFPCLHYHKLMYTKAAGDVCLLDSFKCTNSSLELHWTSGMDVESSVTSSLSTADRGDSWSISSVLLI